MIGWEKVNNSFVRPFVWWPLLITFSDFISKKYPELSIVFELILVFSHSTPPFCLCVFVLLIFNVLGVSVELVFSPTLGGDYMLKGFFI